MAKVRAHFLRVVVLTPTFIERLLCGRQQFHDGRTRCFGTDASTQRRYAPLNQIVDLRLDLAGQSRLPVLPEGAKGHDRHDFYFSMTFGLATPDDHLDVITFIRNRREPFYGAVFPSSETEVPPERRVEADIGETLYVTQRHALPEQPRAQGPIAALSFVPQQAEDPKP